VKLLVQSISAGKRPDDDGRLRTEIQITYRFGPPSEATAETYPDEESSVVALQNGRTS
jgi:hypothetical protein